MCVMGDLNTWVGDRVKGRYWILEVNDSSDGIHEINTSAGMSIANTYFQYRYVHKYT